MKKIIMDKEIIHQWFGLSYASYLVLPRSILQSAPEQLQKRLVDCLEELESLFGNVPDSGTYIVSLKDENNRFIKDGYRDYERGRRIIPMRKR